MIVRLGVEHEEHVLAILAPVAGLLPERLVVQQRCLDLLEMATLALAHEVDERVVEEGATLGPEHGAGGQGTHHVQIELAPELAMVASLRLLDAKEIRVEILLLPPRRAIDALQLLPPLVATPVRRRH